MTNNIYNSNILFFKEHSVILYNTITTETPLYPDIDVKIFNAKELNFIISNNESKCYLNSLDHKDNQANRMLEQISEDAEILILFGFETGSSLEKIFMNRPKLGHIIIIEPCLQLFKEVLTKRDITGIFKANKSISIILNQTTEEVVRLISYIFQNNRKKKIAFAEHITYRTIFGNMFEQIKELTRDNFISESVNLLTAYHTLHLYSCNFMKNQKHDFIFAEVLFQELKKLKCPVIIVSAGPSLVDNMHMLHELKDKAFIVAVGTAIRVLDVHGIKPHLRIAIDGFPSECIFEGIDTETVPLLYSEKVHSDVLPNYDGMKYMMILNVDRITQYFYNDTGYKQITVRSGYSVANLALDLFAMLGYKKVILIGQNLSFKKEKQYADGASDHYKMDLKGPGIVKARNINNEEILTSLQFLSMRNLFEKIIQQFPETTVINATEGGLPIKGTINMTLEQAVADLEVEPMLTNIHEVVLSKNVGRSGMLPKIRENYKKFVDEIESLLLINNRRVDYLKKYSGYENISNANSKKLSEFESKVKEFYGEFNKIDVYKYVIYPSLEHIVTSLKDTYAYYGEETNMKIQSIYKGVLAEATEVQRFALLLKELRGELDY
ncbi:MAG: hypothetical protein CVU84_08335 [Firmicutes bacterium HGW-Firmicutes-1]|jgi:hypothetical protein|nr:MAG: hypothetical protein CVU84_08335 [Firmicutes bacterium HGW-Firmicutes-1]